MRPVINYSPLTVHTDAAGWTYYRYEAEYSGGTIAEIRDSFTVYWRMFEPCTVSIGGNQITMKRRSGIVDIEMD